MDDEPVIEEPSEAEPPPPPPPIRPPARIAYRHFPDLGGLRKPWPNSPNGAWQNAAFRGYADHMGTAPFALAADTE